VNDNVKGDGVIVRKGLALAVSGWVTLCNLRNFNTGKGCLSGVCILRLQLVEGRCGCWVESDRL